MKRTIATLTGIAVLGSLPATAAVVVAGWDTWSDTGSNTDTYNPSLVATGITGLAVGTADTVEGAYPGWANWGGSAAHDYGASSDGSWGTLTVSPPTIDVSASTAAVGLLNRTPSGEMTFTITNSSGADLELSGFHFDGVRVRTSAPDQWSLSVLPGSAITVGEVTSGTILTDNSTPFLDRENVDIDLSGLGDKVLEAGGVAIFQLAFTGGSGLNSGGQNTMIDNVAVSAIPEPSAALFALAGTLGLFVRRRR